MRRLVGMVMLVALTALSLLAETLTSGLASGEKTPAYNPHHLAGPDRGTDVCPV